MFVVQLAVSLNQTISCCKSTVFILRRHHPSSRAGHGSVRRERRTDSWHTRYLAGHLATVQASLPLAQTVFQLVQWRLAEQPLSFLISPVTQNDVRWFILRLIIPLWQHQIVVTRFGVSSRWRLHCTSRWSAPPKGGVYNYRPLAQ